MSPSGHLGLHETSRITTYFTYRRVRRRRRRRGRPRRGEGRKKRVGPTNTRGASHACCYSRSFHLLLMVSVKHMERLSYMFPCLEQLELRCDWDKPDLEQSNGLKLDNLIKLNITSFEDLSSEHFLFLANFQLKLKNLDLVFKKRGWKNNRGFRVFLKSIAGTLEVLRLMGSERLTSQSINPLPIEFPNLQTIEIDSKLLIDLTWLDGMPRLQKLESKMRDWKEWWNLLNRKGMPTMPHQKLTNLTLGTIDGGCLRKMWPYFKQVTKLDVHEDRIDDVGFRTICEVMQKLTHLRIAQRVWSRFGGDEGNVEEKTMFKISDKGITGMDEETCKELWERLPEVELDLKEIEKRRMHAYIGNLTSLINLDLSVRDSMISDVGIIYGLVCLPKLRSLKLGKCDMTAASLNVLSDMPDLCLLVLRQTSGVTLEMIEAVKQKNTRLHFDFYKDF